MLRKYSPRPGDGGPSRREPDPESGNVPGSGPRVVVGRGFGTESPVGARLCGGFRP